MVTDMLRVLAAATLAISTLVPFFPASAEDILAGGEASVVIYRAGESFKTRAFDLDIFVDSANVGSLNARSSLVASGEPGTYTLRTNLPGTTPLQLELQPGTTGFVHTRLRMVGDRVVVELRQVNEHVARAHQTNAGSTLLTI